MPSRQPSTDNELEILLLGARTVLRPHHRSGLEARLSGPVDWERLELLAYYHGLHTLLHLHLKTLPGSIPARRAPIWQQRSMGIAVRTLFLTRELHALLELLGQHGILCLPYKGPALAQELYGAPSFRRSADLDVLIPRREAVRAKELLRAQGYAPSLELSGAWERAYLRFQHHYKCTRGDGETRELHWAVATRAFACDLSFEEMWESRRSLTVGGKELPVLSPELQLLALCVHASTHCWDRIQLICDIAELLRKYPELDWKGIWERARSGGLLRMTRLGLMLAREVLEAELPEEAASGVDGDPAVALLAANVQQRLVEPVIYFADTRAGARFHLQMRERIRDRLAYLLYNDAVTPHPCDREFLPLPDACYPLYYLVKPLRLALKPPRPRADPE